MDPLNYRLRPYADIPRMSREEFQELASRKKVVLYKELVLDVDDFEHPGYNNILHRYQGQDMSAPYEVRAHSLNADLVVCHRTVGRL
jgi:cytochrome b involved in lipid metabolism